MESPFDVLPVDADADEEEIEQAYRERVKEAHPDQGGSVEEFKAVRRAYERIKAGSWGTENLPERDVADGRNANDRTADDRSADDRPADDRNANGRGAGDRSAGDPNAGGRAPGGRNASDRDGDGRTADGTRSDPITSEVAYLDYDVLADFGWGIDDDDLFRKASAADLDESDYGRFEVRPGESLLEAAEDRGFAWPFACRGGACANCAVLLLDGELSMPASHVLPEELMDRGFRLSCNGMPITAELKVLYNVKRVPELDDLLLPPDPFENRYADD